MNITPTLSVQKAAVIILAAGKGTRMNIPYPKVLADLQGKPLIDWVLDQISQVGVAETVVVVGFGAEQVQTELQRIQLQVKFAVQNEQLGTGHATRSGLKYISPEITTVLVTYGDMPFISAETFRSLIEKQAQNAAAIVITSVHLDDPMESGFGRVIRDENSKVQKIVEQKSCSEAELRIKECNAGSVAYDAEWLRDNITKLPLTTVGEYYLTDLVALAAQQGRLIESVIATDPREMHGINTVEHLRQAEAMI